MSDLLTIGSTAVSAYQRALGTVSNNIANVGTEGYVRQETSMSENMPRQQGRIYLGTGVSVAGIKRAYDEFLESNLRNSTSDLNNQEPMVSYANRVVDILGSDTVGLPPAMDKFFAAARALSADPASNILRGQFLRDSDGLAARFRELSTQMTTVDTETREMINARVADINTIAGQIAIVNRQMSKHPFADRQPPDLMDQRDLLLTKLSALVRIKVNTAVNGSVEVSVGNVTGAGTLVKGDKSLPVQAQFDENDLSRVTLISDPYAREPRILSGVSGGQLGGLMGFREQVLQPTILSLDYLATTVAGEINAIHREGIDARGSVGQDLFRINPVMRTDPLTGQSIAIDRASAGIAVNITDPTRVAAAALFRVIENENNVSGVDASLTYSPNYADPLRVKSLSQVLKNNPNVSAGIVPPTGKLLGQIPIGAVNWSLSLDGATGDQQIQVLTRDGRHLMGSALSKEDQELLLSKENGFVSGTTYESRYLNQTGKSGYKQMDLFYGQMARPSLRFDTAAQFTPAAHDPLSSTQFNEVENATSVPSGLEAFGGNRLTINGKVLPGLLPAPPATTIQASDIATWLNKATENMLPPVMAVASNRVAITMNEGDAGKEIVLNGVTIPAEADRTTEELAQLIKDDFRFRLNADASDPNVLVLTNATDYEGRDIKVNDLAYKGTLAIESEGDVTLGYGPEGKLGDLAMLGKPSGNYYTEMFVRIPNPAVISGRSIPASVEDIAPGALTLNGKSLGGLNLNRALQASDYVRWISDAGAMMQPPVQASASNSILVQASKITPEALANRVPQSLTINGVTITGSNPDGSFRDSDDIVAAINASRTGKVLLDPALLVAGTSVTLNGVRIDGPVTAQAIEDAGLNLTAVSDDQGRLVVRDPSGKEVLVSAQYDDNAMSLITLPKDHLDLSRTVDFGNGVLGPFNNAKDMIDKINASGSGVTITASFDQNGNFASDPLVSGATSSQLRNIAPKGTIAFGVVADKTTIPAAQFNFNAPLILNGITVNGSGMNGSFADAADVVASINRSIGTNVYAMLTENGDINLQTEMPGGIAVGADLTARAVYIESSVSASLDAGGNLILGNGTGTDIRIGTTVGTNALAIGNGIYKGSLTLSSAGEIRVGVGESGTPAQLAQLGLSTSIFVEGEVSEDLLVFVTGEGSGLISGSYDESMANPASLDAKRVASLRAQKFDVSFISADRYQITWKHPVSGAVTVVAERDYDPLMGIEYRGVKLTLDNPPAKGDRFTIDGNQDGTGDNYNMLSLIDLETKKVIGGPNGITLAQAYEEEVGKIGNFASQSATAQKALEVVNNQAIESRDKVSGVSLDAEAADLIRFQQAYQAAAKAMQTSGVLFDAILQAG